jgi:RNA polymerase sigma-70 factor, ECF subfamily
MKRAVSGLSDAEVASAARRHDDGTAVTSARVWIRGDSAGAGEMINERQLDPQALGDHIDRLYRSARALCRSREEAEDLVQETFARVLRRPRMLRADNDLGYLLRALRNTFVSTRRTASRRPRTEPLADCLEFVEDRRAVRAEASAEAGEVYTAVSVLPDDFRKALVAVDVVGLSYPQAARALGVRTGTIATRLHRARKRVAEAMLAQGEATRQPITRPTG